MRLPRSFQRNRRRFDECGGTESEGEPLKDAQGAVTRAGSPEVSPGGVTRQGMLISTFTLVSSSEASPALQLGGIDRTDLIRVLISNSEDSDRVGCYGQLWQRNAR